MSELARYSLRSALRRVTHSRRERQCGVVPCHTGGPVIWAVGKPSRWKCQWKGVATCGHIWTCPVCSAKLRTARLARVFRALEVSEGRWQMVTLTIRHHAGEALAPMLHGMLRAFAYAKQGGTLQRIWTERVSASVRATEITYGANGWHPHLHVLVRSSEWSEDERAELVERWTRAVRDKLGAAHVPVVGVGVVWSTAIDATHATERDRARYLAKLGVEIAGESKEGRPGQRTSWQVAQGAASGNERDVHLWREFSDATKGRRMLYLDARATAYGKTPLDLDPAEHDFEPDVVVIPLDSLELRAVREYERRIDPHVLGDILAAAAVAERPQKAVTLYLDIILRELERAPGIRAGPRPWR